MSLTYGQLTDNPKWLSSNVTPGLVSANGSVTIAGNTYTTTSDVIANVPSKNTLILFADENISTIQSLISVQQQLQKALLTKIHGSALSQDYDVNGAGVAMADYQKSLLNKNPTLAANLVLTDPIPGVLSLGPTNLFSQYLDYSQFLTQSGTPIKNRIAKLDKTASDTYYYIEYPYYKAIEALHQAYMTNTSLYPYVDLSFVSELRFSGSTNDIEMNMNRLDVTSVTDMNNIMALKNQQLSGLKKITITNLEGDVQIKKGAFAQYNFAALESIEFNNINGRVVIEAEAFANTSMPNLKTITFNDITKGLVIQDSVFATPALPKLANLVFASIQNELTVGNNVFPSSLSAQINSLGFRSNTGRITILDTVLKNLIKIDNYNSSHQGGYGTYDDEFQWIKDKLTIVEGLVRSGFRNLLDGGGDTSSCGAGSGCNAPLTAKEKCCKRMAENGAQIAVGVAFLGVASYLLFYVLRSQTAN